LALCVYVVYQTAAMKGLDDMKFDILHLVSEHFDIGINNVLIAGSAQTGESFHKQKAFDCKESDLDIALVDPGLYERCIKAAYEATRDYSDLSGFERKEGISTQNEFLENLARGFFRPDLMPNCKYKSSWFNFFQDISKTYQSNFKSINAGVYSSLYFFQKKQAKNIDIVKTQTQGK
jgi:hypothetical protein